jgi:hypothetical protein
VIYLADAAASKPPQPTLAALLTPRAAASVRGFKPSSSGCPPLAGGAKSNYCWSMNWNIFEAPTTPAIFPKSSPSAATYTFEATQGDVIDLILINPSRMVHPQHLHGSGFFVLAAGNGNPLGADGLSLAPGLKLNLKDPPVKDTIAVPQAVGEGAGGYGYSIVRFKADNPGPWAFRESLESAEGVPGGGFPC